MSSRAIFLLAVLCASAAAAVRSDTLHFEPTADGGIVARSGAQVLEILPSSADIFFSGGNAPARMTLVNADRKAPMELLDRLPAYSNYLTGNQPEAWRTRVPRFARVRVRNAYPGIDVVYYANQRNVEFDFIVNPGADASRIQMAWSGVDSIRQSPEGDLLLRSASNRLAQRKPRVYQEGRGEVASAYRLRQGTVEIALARYDSRRPLVIDPVIDFSTYLGGAGYETGIYVATDAGGNVYVTGAMTSNTIVGRNVAQELHGGANDAFVAKFSSSGDLAWFTYLGGSGHEVGNGIAVDATGIYVSGETTSMNFPLRNPVQNTFNGGFDDAFLSKLSLNGDSFIYSTYIGGGSDDFGIGLAVDGLGAAFMTGWSRSTDFLTGYSLQRKGTGGGQDAFIVKVAPSGRSVDYLVMIGGNSNDLATGVALDSAGNAYVTGQTFSANFPTTTGSFQTARSGFSDAFLTKLSPDGSTQVYSTLLGGSGNELGNRLVVDTGGNAYVTGYTESTNFPVSNAAQGSLGGRADTFVTKFSPAGNSTLFSTYLGGSGDDFGYGSIALDTAGSVYVCGYTASPNFPTLGGVQTAYGGGAFDGFVTKLTAVGAIAYSTYYGGSGEDWAIGIALDRSNNVYITGRTATANLPRARTEFNTGSGTFDVFLARLSGDAGGAANLLTPAPSTLVFTGRTGTAISPQTVRLSTTAAAVNYAVAVNTATGGQWLSATPAAGLSSTDSTVTISVNAAAVPPGTHTGTVTLNAPAALNGPVVIPVRLVLTAAPNISSLSSTSLAAGAQETVLTVNGTGFLPESLVAVNGVTVPTSFVSDTALRATLSSTLLASPVNLQIQVRNPEGLASSILSNSATLEVTAPGPVFAASGVLNAASYLAGGIAPGEIITIFGAAFGPANTVSAPPDAAGVYATSLSGMRVLFDDQPAPVLSAGPNQVSVVVPYAVAGRQSVALRLEYQGVRSASAGIPVVAAAPAVFTTGSNGRGQAAAVNADGTLNNTEQPAVRGSVITLFATGEGQTLPAGMDGRIVQASGLTRPTEQVRVTVGGVPAEVLYAGGAPGFVAGLLQINVRIPESLPANAGAAPLLVTISQAASPAGVTIAVR